MQAYTDVQLEGLSGIGLGASMPKSSIQNISAGVMRQVAARIAGLPIDRNAFSLRQVALFDTLELTTAGSNVVAAKTGFDFFTRKAIAGLCNFSEGRTTSDKPIIIRAFGVQVYNASITNDALSVVAGNDEFTASSGQVAAEADFLRTAEINIQLGKSRIWNGLAQDAPTGVGPTQTAAAAAGADPVFFATVHNGMPGVMQRNFLPAPEVIWPDLDIRPTLTIPAAITFGARTVCRLFLFGERIEVGGFSSVS